MIITARKRSLGQGNIFTPVCHSVHRVGSASVHAGIPPPQDHAPQGTMHPPVPCTPRDHPPPETMHPPGAEHAGRYSQRAGGTHPTGMQSCYVFQMDHRLKLEWYYCKEPVQYLKFVTVIPI